MCPHHLSIPPESVKTTQTCFYLKNGRCTNITTLSHLAHCVVHPAEVLKISVFGDIELSYFGFGDESKEGRASNNDNRVSDMYASPVVCVCVCVCVKGQSHNLDISVGLLP